MPSLHFPSAGHQVLSCLVHFLGVSVLSFCFARRVGTLTGLSKIAWPRLCIILIFIYSWLFLFSSGILIFGLGLELDPAVCSTAVFFCIFFYATSKFFVYMFLIERIHVVWMPATGIKRFKSRIYVICFITVCLYAVVIGLMVCGRIDFFRDGDAACVIGLKHISSYPLLIYDLYITIFLTALFLIRLRRSGGNARLRRLATHALMSSTIALVTSTTNIVILGVVGGTELGWLCLASCGCDVIVNALSIFWVTGITIRPHRTVSIYSSTTNQFRPSAGPMQSILKRPTSTSSQTLIRSGKQLMTSAYDRFKEESTYSSSPRAIESVSYEARRWSRSSYIQDPNHPFARASYVPKVAEPQSEVRGNPDAKSPSALRSFAERFWPMTISQDPEVKNVEISVTTTVGVESLHESPLSAEPPPFQGSQLRRQRSCSI